MFLDPEENNQEERTNNQIEETERKKLACPKCDEKFKDMRGLTSHARHKHDINRNELIQLLNKKEQDNYSWKIVSGVGSLLLAIITLGKMR